ncbi:hypothetical protein [Rhizobium sp. Root1220]|uniref:hypothetical protein n=1 Tax=Rhizobium sp. Root1220 TaxID=1736432 RepID=UPI0006FE81D1|nr:hypothetical protein [Rhizobium sp. Root1220]KQV64642.1 hypothetical protein ASC90_16610 [Rhizobium sp. Root1220]
MRLNIITATSVLALGLASTAYAVDINQDGAKAIQQGLTRLLPPEAVRDGFVTVNPAGTRYEIIYDFARLLNSIDPASFAISGLTPWSMFATPQDSGLWKIDGDNSLDVSGHVKAADQSKTDFTYVIESLVYSGVFDTTIRYFRSGDFTTKGVRFSSKTDAEEVSASVDHSQYKLTSSNGATAGRTNFAASGRATAFVERISGKQVPPVEIRADTIDFAAAVNGLPAKEISDIVVFALEHAEDKTLRPAESEKLKATLRDAFPLLTSLSETIDLSNFTVSSEAGSGVAKELTYEVSIDGPSNAMRLGVGLAAQQVSFDSPLVPAGYSAFVPEAMQVQFAVANLDFAAFGEEFMKVDLTRSNASDDAGQKAAEALFNGGDLVIDFPKISAVSSVYDAEVSGNIHGRIDSAKDYSMDASILARDFDKTIAAVQDLAKTNPDLNHVSFGLMMAKGFAKTEPDGRQRWDINVARSGAVTVNGQVIKGAD